MKYNGISSRKYLRRLYAIFGELEGCLLAAKGACKRTTTKIVLKQVCDDYEYASTRPPGKELEAAARLQ